MNPTPGRGARASVVDKTARPKRPRCPICRKPSSQDYRPFCSSACADVDLDRWLAGRYAVPGEPIGATRDDDGSEEDAES